MPTVITSIAAGTDDAYQLGSGPTYDDLGVLDIFSYSDPGSDNYRCAALRFVLADIPQGATIGSAYLTLFFTNRDNPFMDIYAQAADDPPNFITVAEIINSTSRPRTTASVEWNAESIGQQQAHQSPSLVTVVQEVVNRPGWVPGNHIVILLIAKQQGVVWARIEAQDDTGAANQAVLTVEYTVPAPPGPVPVAIAIFPDNPAVQVAVDAGGSGTEITVGAAQSTVLVEVS